MTRSRLAPFTGLRGFTLLEVMIAVTTLSLLLAFAGPKIRELSNRMKANAAAQQIAGDLERARTEAIKRSTSVSVRKTGAHTYTIEYLGSRELDAATFVSAPDSVVFAAFGPTVLGGGTYVLRSGGHTRSVVVNAAGRAEVR